MSSSVATNGHSSTDLLNLKATKLLFHSGSHQQTYEHQTKLSSISAFDALSEADRSVAKLPSDLAQQLYAITTASTIFHPQGGGQPSDVGGLAITGSDAGLYTFTVLTARTSATNPSVVLHFGHFTDKQPDSLELSGVVVDQNVDAGKRRLFSRLHTAGHVLGAATRTQLEHQVANFDELKASHFPDSAACEFQGSIDGKYKPEIQSAVDEMVSRDAEVRIGWWTKSDFRERKLERLLLSDEDWRAIAIAVDSKGEEAEESGNIDDERTRIRVVDIVGAEVYPCGGTHVATTKECGKVTVKKISRQKGNSRVSYFVD